jgi:P4 family phage/plasmid primase-like protien
MCVKYDANATCPKIDAFIHNITCPHRIDAVYEISGYAILPRKMLKRAIIFVGVPDTGKSTLISVISVFVGELRISDVSPMNIGDDHHASYNIYGKMMNRIDDLGTSDITETGVLKSVISSKPIRANQKYGEPFTFTPHALVIFGCNQVPVCNDVYLMDKFDILEFTNQHTGKAINPNLDIELTTDEEMSGFFNKCIVAVKTALENRTFTGSYTLEDRQKAYVYHSNPIARFVDTCCDVTDSSAYTEKSLFRKAYVEWSKEQNTRVIPVGRQTSYLQDIGSMLSREGGRGDQIYVYTGISLHPNVITSYGNDNCCEKHPVVDCSATVVDPENDSSTPKNDLVVKYPPHSTQYRKNDNNDVGSRMAKNLTTKPKNDSSTPKTGSTTDILQSTTDKTIDPDIDSKLKHAVGKAITQSDTIGAELSKIVECYPGNLSMSDVLLLLEERGESLGITERYNKWYVS